MGLRLDPVRWAGWSAIVAYLRQVVERGLTAADSDRIGAGTFLGRGVQPGPHPIVQLGGMGASHQKRPALGGVVHVTQKICAGLPGLRTKATFRVIADAVRAGNEKPGFRVVAFSVLSNHFHYIVEAQDEVRLARGVQGLAIRVARALNRHWRRRGKVFLERYFARALRKMQAMRRAFVYVLHNARRHGIRIPAGEPDPFSSGPWFRFWRGRPASRTDPSPVVPPRHPTLELVLGRRLGLDERPRSSWTGIAPW